jgi:hypothetical protein
MTIQRFTAASFSNPPAAFRPLQIVHGFDGMLTNPAKLEGEEGIAARLDKLRSLGIGGVVANVGFKDYLQSPRQWEIYRAGLRAAAARDMVLWWYDEKGYPSGTAGGIVTRSHPEYAALGLACYRVPVRARHSVDFMLPVSCRAFVWAGAIRGDLAKACRERIVDLTPHVDRSGTLRWEAPAGKWTILYLAERVMYEGTHAAGNVCEFKHYANLMDRRAVAEFIRVTHEQYVRQTPPDLWKRMRAVFTDEPSFMTYYHGHLPDRFEGKVPVVDAPLFIDRPPAVPWLGTFLAEFRKRKGYDLRPFLYGLFCSHSEEAAYARQDYYEIAARLYADAFYGQIAAWCRKHGIAFSGHVLAEECLDGHVTSHGSLFEVVRKMDLPGIDMLDSDPGTIMSSFRFMAAKQVASVAHLTGAKEVHCECSDWVQRNGNIGATLAQRRGQGNVLYALGINQVTAYWSWDDIGDEGYRAYNDYMARLALLLRGGRHVCDVAVVYPIRAAWATYVPGSPIEAAKIDDGRLYAAAWRLANEGYAQPVRDLLQNQIDLDVVDEQAIVEGSIDSGALCVADERYRVVVLCAADTLGAAAGEKLTAFARAGGTVIFLDAPPKRAESPAATRRLRRAVARIFASGHGRRVPRAKVVAAVRKAAVGDFVLGSPDPDILYTHRHVDGRHVYFVVNDAPEPRCIRPQLGVPGEFALYRPLTGVIEPPGPVGEIRLEGLEGVFLVGGRSGS